MNDLAKARPKILPLAGLFLLFLIPAAVAARTGRLDVLEQLADAALVAAAVLALYYAYVGLLSKHGAWIETTTRYPCGATEVQQGYTAHGFTYYPAGSVTGCPRHQKRCKTRPDSPGSPLNPTAAPLARLPQVPRGGGDE